MVSVLLTPVLVKKTKIVSLVRTRASVRTVFVRKEREIPVKRIPIVNLVHVKGFVKKATVVLLRHHLVHPMQIVKKMESVVSATMVSAVLHHKVLIKAVKKTPIVNSVLRNTWVLVIRQRVFVSHPQKPVMQIKTVLSMEKSVDVSITNVHFLHRRADANLPVQAEKLV